MIRLPSILASAPPEDRSGALHRSTALLPAALAGGLFCDSRREEGSDRQLFLQAVWTGLVLLDPSFFRVGFEGRRNFALKRLEVGRHLVDGDFPVISPVPDIGCDQLVDRLHPPLPQDRAGQGP